MFQVGLVEDRRKRREIGKDEERSQNTGRIEIGTLRQDGEGGGHLSKGEREGGKTNDESCRSSSMET